MAEKSKKKSEQLFKMGFKSREKIIVGIVTAVLAIVVIGYFAFATGLVSRTVTGATIAGENISVAEMNYFVRQNFIMYTYYGLLKDEKDMENVFDKETGQTYRAYFQELAGKSLQEEILLIQRAKEAGFKGVAYKRQVEQDMWTLNDTAKQYKLTAAQYLANQYGASMTLRIYRNILERSYFVQEYRQELVQNDYRKTSEEVDALYKENPADFEKADFNIYSFPITTAADASEEDKAKSLEEVKALAQTVVDNAKNPAEFKEETKNALGTEGETYFQNEADPTLKTAFTKGAVKSSYNDEVADFIFSKDRKANDTIMVAGEEAAFAVMFTARTLDEENRIEYRQLSLTYNILPEATPTPVPTTEATAEVTSESSAQEATDTSSNATISGSEGSESSAPETTKPSEKSVAEPIEATQIDATAGTEETTSDPTLAATPSPIVLDKKATKALAATQARVAEIKALGPSEKDFALIVKKETDDFMNLSNGGLISNKSQSSFVNDEEKEFADWLFQTDRKTGDLFEYKTDETVYLYFFQSQMPAWKADFILTDSNESLAKWVEEQIAVEENKIVIHENNLKRFGL